MKKYIGNIGAIILALMTSSCSNNLIDESKPHSNLLTMNTEKGRAHADKSVAVICAKKPVQKRVKFIQTVCASSDCKIKSYSYSCIQ